MTVTLRRALTPLWLPRDHGGSVRRKAAWPLVGPLGHHEDVPERTVTGLTQGMLKFAAGSASGRKIAEWELPDPMEESGMRRLATVQIPHRGLIVPVGFSGSDDETVLIPPPPESHQLDVDILLEPDEVSKDAWPDQTGQGSLLVGRFSLYTDSSDKEWCSSSPGVGGSSIGLGCGPPARW
jgi:hypothetical protein